MNEAFALYCKQIWEGIVCLAQFYCVCKRNTGEKMLQPIIYEYVNSHNYVVVRVGLGVLFLLNCHCGVALLLVKALARGYIHTLCYGAIYR